VVDRPRFEGGPVAARLAQDREALLLYGVPPTDFERRKPLSDWDDEMRWRPRSRRWRPFALLGIASGGVEAPELEATPSPSAGWFVIETSDMVLAGTQTVKDRAVNG
jgi:hypothetical protein